MSERKTTQSIRVRLDQETLERIDQLVGARGRQRFIRDAILWRLEQDYPPLVKELAERVDSLHARVENLERTQLMGKMRDELNDTVANTVCRDDLDRRVLTYFIQRMGATTTELAQDILGSESKRTTILNRINSMNERAIRQFGVPLFRLEKGMVRDKRGAWWLQDIEHLIRARQPERQTD